MFETLAHITTQEIPSFWLALAIGFVAGASFMFACVARKLR